MKDNNNENILKALEENDNQMKELERVRNSLSGMVASVRVSQRAIDALSTINENELFTFNRLAHRFIEAEYEQYQELERELDESARTLGEIMNKLTKKVG